MARPPKSVEIIQLNSSERFARKSDSAKAYELPDRDHAFGSLGDGIIRAFQLIN